MYDLLSKISIERSIKKIRKTVKNLKHKKEYEACDANIFSKPNKNIAIDKQQ